MPSFRRLFAVLALAPVPLAAQQARSSAPPTSLSLAEAIRVAERESESVRIARAAVDRARGQRQQARSQLYPQVTGTASYQRALQSQFAEISKRVSSGDTTSGSGSGGSFADSPLARVFASKNTMVLGITGSQTIYTGGRVRAGIAASEAAARAADLGTRTARAQLVYDVAQAYIDAQVAEQLLVIADSSLAQAERALRQTQLARDVGNTAEYDLIRARVQRDNVRPAVIAARTQRDVAFLRLRQMLNLASDAPLSLTTPIESVGASQMSELRAATDLVSVTPDTGSIARSAVRQAEQSVLAEEQQLRATRAQRLPQIALTTNYQRFSYPSGVIEDRIKMYFPNWTLSLGLSLPIYTGGRLEGEQVAARANVADAQARYTQAREAATLDARLALAQLEQADATYAASTGTDEQAARGYAIAEVRFNEGLATQLELAQARVDLGTARANRAQAARDVALAHLRLALLRDLPLTAPPAGVR